VLKGWQIVAAFVGAGYLWGFIEIAPFARATTRTLTYLAQAVFAQPQISKSVSALGLRNGIPAESTGVGTAGPASGPAADLRIVNLSMREWQTSPCMTSISDLHGTSACDARFRSTPCDTKAPGRFRRFGERRPRYPIAESALRHEGCPGTDR